jgi:hypothetical protein
MRVVDRRLAVGLAAGVRAAQLLPTYLTIAETPLSSGQPPTRSRLTSQSSNTIQALHAWQGSQFGKHPCSIGRL